MVVKCTPVVGLLRRDATPVNRKMENKYFCHQSRFPFPANLLKTCVTEHIWQYMYIWPCLSLVSVHTGLPHHGSRGAHMVF